MNFEKLYDELLWSTRYNIKLFYQKLYNRNEVSLKELNMIGEDRCLLLYADQAGCLTDAGLKLYKECDFIGKEYNLVKCNKYGYKRVEL